MPRPNSRSEDRFDGVIGLTADESTPWWPEPVRAKEGAPNILYIVLDDVGFAQLGCYGGLGGIVETPNIDRLAEGGLRYNNFHTTALCSPTRSCLLTGRNHHSNHMAGITEISTGYPGYNGQIPKTNGFLSEMLVPEGYATFAIGKWHLTPNEESNMAAPRDRWPLGRGFERFYGFLGGETNQYYPDLMYDNHPVEPPRRPEEGYHLTEDLTDKAIEFVKDLKHAAPDKPFLLYFCPGACHAPHHVPKEWADGYKGKFDMGWDVVREATLARQKEMGVVSSNTELSPRPDWIKAWKDLTSDEQRLYARMMEVFAGFLSHTDHHIGRLIGLLEEIGELDNTLIILVSDNGASAEGGPTGSVNENRFFNGVPESLEDNLTVIDKLGGPETYNHYPFGWVMAGNTPLKRWKREVHQGGMSDPMIVHWPRGIEARGEIRHQYAHAIDIAPTVLELLGVEPPTEISGVAQKPIEGVSFANSFKDAEAPTRKEVQYYEMLGSRALWYRGWKAVTYHVMRGAYYGAGDPNRPFADDVWELYNTEQDFSECYDLAGKYPKKLRELIDRWWVEAGKYNVLPLDDRGVERLVEPRPQITKPRRHYVYYPGGTPLPEQVAVNVKNRSHAITAEVEIPEGGAEGVLIAQGSKFAGYSFFVKDNRLYYVHNFVGMVEYTITSDVDLPTGRCTLRFEFTKTGENQGTGALFIGDRKVGEGPIPHTVPIEFGLAGEGFCCGWDSGAPVSNRYQSPFTFTGIIKKVTVDVAGLPHRDLQKEAEMAIARH